MPLLDPFTSIEVRWFFDGSTAARPLLASWYQAAGPFDREVGVGPPAFEDRQGGMPDVYLLIPGADDMGIKWREGLLQIKGLVNGVGEASFAGRHRGTVGRWIKWSYAGLPEPYRLLFSGDAPEGVVRIPVFKRRALRLFELPPADAPVREVGVGSVLERGLAVELTELRIGAGDYCSLGFEAFPDDAHTRGRFNDTVSALVESLPVPELEAGRSQPYPGWLQRFGPDGRSR